MPFLCFAVGSVLIVFILLDTFEAVVLPRRISRPYRLTRQFYRLTWGVWRRLVRYVPARRTRRSLFSAYGPLSLFGLFGLWAVGLIVGFGLLHCAITLPDRTLFESLYLSGTTFTTLGYGDVTPQNGAGRVLAIVEALVGFGFLAVVIGFLPVFYQAFSRRERMIALLDARAGSPPCAGQLLLRLPIEKGHALDRFLIEAELWAAEVLESHLSYPVLNHYRSQHDNQSWLATLTCTLDVSAFILTFVEGADRQQARLTFAMARHAIVDLSLGLRRPPVAPLQDRLPNDLLTKLLDELRKRQVTVRENKDVCTKLTELRALYEPFANALANYLQLELPPIWNESPAADNWQTSAWARRAGGILSLGYQPDEEHDD